MRKPLLTYIALLAGAYASSASVTVQGWWHLDSSQPINDSSGFSRTFGSAFSTAPSTGGQFGGLVLNNGAGGPLGTTGYISTNAVRAGIGVGAKRQSSMWGISYNPPATNYGIEIWAMPQRDGFVGNTTWYFSSGQSGGVLLQCVNNGPGVPASMVASIIGTAINVGYPAPIDTNRWTHYAIVNNNGVTTFYTNGVPCGPSDTNNWTASAGDVYIGTPSDNQAPDANLDEARMFTFAPGAFSVSDLLLRPPGPNIVGQPQNITVWSGGATSFTVNPSYDNSLLYQWRRGGVTLAGQTAQTLYLNQVTTADTGSTFDCILTGGGIHVTSAVATLTVVLNNPSDVAAYHNAVNAEPSLVADFPVDSDTGATLTNTKDGTHNGTFELGATYDGRTNTTFGVRSISFNYDGDVTIPNNPAFEFANGNGTIEAIIYMSQASVTEPTIVSEAQDLGTSYYVFGASGNGTALIYSNDLTGELSWQVPGGLVGKISHVALVFDNTTNITAYCNGQSLGTKNQPGFGSGGATPFWIGGIGTSSTDYRWGGTIDEVAVYTNSLSQNTIQLHYSAFVYGTNTAPPSIVSQPSSKTLLSGASPVLAVQAGGTLPLSYQWSLNGVNISGATTASLAISNVSANATYSLHVQNAYGSTNTQPIVLTAGTPPAGYATMAMSDHPTAFWRLSDTSGTTAVDSAGFNDATYSGGFTLGAPAFHGESGTAVNLNGSTGHAIAPLTPVLNPAGPFTIEFWAVTPRGGWTAAGSSGFMVPVGSMDRPGRTGGYEFYLDGNYTGYEFHTAIGGGYDQITGDNYIPPANTWSYVVGVYDGTSITLYVNGALASDPTYPDPTFTPNTVKGLYIGSREDNVRYWQGSIADVAFYNYALSALQISNHYSVSYQAASIVTQPVGVTNVEGSTITVSVVAAGLPNSYQWVKDGSNLSDVNNFDGTRHYPNGVTNASLTIAQTVPADSGQYHVVISNPLGGATSANATVRILADTNPPVVTAAIALGTPNASGPTPYLLKVLFNKRIDPVSGIVPANYSISGGVTVSAVNQLGDVTTAPFGADWRVVYLTTSGLTPGQKYSVTVSNVKDQAQTPNTIAPAPAWFRAPLLTQGALEWDYYYLFAVTPNIGPVSLTTYSNYPAAPNTNRTTTVFDTHQITGGDLNNQGYGSFGDNYGDSLSGWITPTVSGQYYFFLASDDASELFLSTDSNPANVVSIAQELTCCHGFQEPGAATTSGLISLNAGTPYFIQALHTEGGGGDYVEVAWRSSTDSTAATNLPPIQAQFLSGYAPVPRPTFGTITHSGNTLTIAWSGYQAVLQQSTDLVNWSAVPGNPNPLVVNVTAAPRIFYRLAQ